MKQEKKSKFSASFESISYTLLSRNRSRATAIREDGRTITRNVCFFKEIQGKSRNDSDDNYDLYKDIHGESQETPVQADREPRYPVRQRKIPQRYGDFLATD